MDQDTPEATARRARSWGRPVTGDEADAILAELDAARGRAAAVVEAYRKVPRTVRATCGDELADALDALDAAPAAATTSGEEA